MVIHSFPQHIPLSRFITFKAHAYKPRMDELLRVCQGLSATRPQINLEQLLALESPVALFCDHVPAETGRDYWVYTIGDNPMQDGKRDGKTLEGELIVVRASLPNQAESMAQEGLADTIEAAKRYDANTGLSAEVEVRGVE